MYKQLLLHVFVDYNRRKKVPYKDYLDSAKLEAALIIAKVEPFKLQMFKNAFPEEDFKDIVTRAREVLKDSKTPCV